MIQIQRILFPTDFSASAHQAFDLALLLAREYDAEIYMLHVVVLHEDDPYSPAHHFPEPEAIRRRLEELGKSAMAELLSSSGDASVKVRQEQRRGIDTASTILEYAEKSEVELIVIGTHGRRGLTHFLLGSVAEKVVRHAACPVLTVRGADPPMPSRTVARILAPVDFSRHSRSALAVARELAERYGAHVEVLHVVEDLSYPPFYGLGFDLTEKLVERAEAALERVVAEVLDSTPGVHQHVVHGRRAAPEVIRFADGNGVDLIVTSTHGHGGLEQLFYGSTAERVVQLSTVPVLTLRPFGQRHLGEQGEVPSPRS